MGSILCDHVGQAFRAVHVKNTKIKDRENERMLKLYQYARFVDEIFSFLAGVGMSDIHKLNRNHMCSHMEVASKKDSSKAATAKHADNLIVAYLLADEVVFT